MMKKRTTHGYFLESTQLLFKNAQEDEEINALLVPYKIDEAKYDYGISLCTRGFKSDRQQLKLHGQQYRARKKFEKLQNEANEGYQIHLRFLRISFEKDVEKLKELSAYGIRTRSIADWLKEAQDFYQNTVVDEEAMAELDSFGITAELFQQNETKITEVDAAYREHKLKLGAAQDAIVQRDEIFKELAIFRKKFIAICRTALKDHPQLLEKLGIKAYTEGYVRAKPKKKEEQPPTDGGSTQTAPTAEVASNVDVQKEPVAVETVPNNNKKKKRK
ncbi:MAG: hypothetical protein QG657_916 [Acidobacteriota bacterium]|nr:hypothetical protein [Acidobacteriota bacterium]